MAFLLTRHSFPSFANQQFSQKIVSIMRISIFSVFTLLSSTLAGDCGPANNNQVCASIESCSNQGWAQVPYSGLSLTCIQCGTSPTHCAFPSCLIQFSGFSSPCQSPYPTTLQTSTSTSPSSPLGFGKCNVMDKPGEMGGGIEIAGRGETCGPIVGRKCVVVGVTFVGWARSFVGVRIGVRGGWGRAIRRG